ncbi:hypothetical protein ACYSNX_03590 [Myroides sp. LJL115]
MIKFKSNLSYYINLIEKQESNNIILSQILSYLSSEHITFLGFYALLENNNIYHLKSIKRDLLHAYCSLKKSIQSEQKYINWDHLQDLRIIKNLWQIEALELLEYKKQDVEEILNLQNGYFSSQDKKESMKCKQNLDDLKDLLGFNTKPYASA